MTGCSTRDCMPADEDAFVSYLQSVSSLARQLQLKFDTKPNGAAIPGFAKPGARDFDERIQTSFEEVMSYQVAVCAIPQDVRERLHELHAELLKTTRAECDQLTKLHRKKPLLLANDWDRYRRAMSSVNRPDTKRD